MGSAFHQLCPRYSGTLTPTAPTAMRLWETFTFFLLVYFASLFSAGLAAEFSSCFHRFPVSISFEPNMYGCDVINPGRL